MKFFSILMVIIISSSASADMMCGLYRIDIQRYALVVNGRSYDYTTSLLKENGYVVHYYDAGNEVRVTQHNRVAYRQVRVTSWNKCVPLVYYQEKQRW